MEKLIEEFSIGLFFWQTVIFIILIFLLKNYAWGPILKAVNDREQGIKDALQSAELAKEEMESLKADNDKSIFINIFPDDPFNISDPSISNREFLKTIPEFDVFCIWSKKIKGI